MGHNLPLRLFLSLLRDFEIVPPKIIQTNRKLTSQNDLAKPDVQITKTITKP